MMKRMAIAIFPGTLATATACSGWSNGNSGVGRDALGSLPDGIELVAMSDEGCGSGSEYECSRTFTVRLETADHDLLAEYLSNHFGFEIRRDADAWTGSDGNEFSLSVWVTVADGTAEVYVSQWGT